MRPYKETFVYDAFGHLTERPWNSWWSGGGGAFTPTHQDYQNERNVNWQYDADGNLTDTGSTQFSNYVQYTVDAAGRNSRTVSVAIDSYHDPDSTVWGSSVDLTQGFDGDGNKVKKVANDTTIDYTEGNTTTTTTTYLVRSSVLNQVLTELSETGQKQRTFVYLGSAVLAWQRQSMDNSQAVLWEHRDPSNASYRVTASGGGSPVSQESAELDPLGNNAGLSNSIPNPQHKQAWSYPGFGSSGMSGDSQCMLDGTFEPCDFVFRAAAAGGLSWMEVPSSFSGSVGNRTPVKVDDPPTYDPPTTDPNNPQPNGIVTIYEHHHYEWVSTGDITTSIQSRQPQNSQQVMVRIKDVNELKRLMEERLAYGDCREAVARLISTAESMSNSIDKIVNAALSTDVMTLFDKINAMPNGGGYHINFLRSDLPKNLPPVSGGSGLAHGTIGGGNANVWIFLKGGYSDNPASLSRLPFDYGISGIHETIHLAGRSSTYSEALMDAAAQALDKNGYSDFDHYLFEHCLPPNLRGF